MSVDSGLSQEEILEGMPYVEITENDYALAVALSALPEIREAALQEGGVEFQIEDFKDLFSAYLPEALDGDDSWIEIWERSVHVSYAPLPTRRPSIREYSCAGIWMPRRPSIRP